MSNTGVIQNSTLCYKDGPQLPPLNFTTVCEVYGRYVIIYNERLNEIGYPEGYASDNVFTELCEVFVYGCEKPGVYGSRCNTKCPENCENNICHIQNGNCFACTSGWTGAICKAECGKGGMV